MNDDEKGTRIIRSDDQQPSSGATRKVTSGAEPFEMGGAPRTRVISAFANPEDESSPDSLELTVGWLVIVDGPGKGSSREIYYGMNGIGRGEDVRIPLDFGDTAISRDAHAYLTFDEKTEKFYIQHAGKSNVARLNDELLLTPSQLKSGDLIELGQTVLRFVPLCGPDFSWKEPQD